MSNWVIEYDFEEERTNALWWVKWLFNSSLDWISMFFCQQLYISLFSFLRVRIINAVSNWKLLKIGSYHTLKFGGSRKKPYLCTIVRRKAALGIVQVNLTLRSFALSLRLISEWRCKDTDFFWNHQILGGDKGRFSAAFKLKLR